MKWGVDDPGSDGIESNVLVRVFQSQASQSCVHATFSDHRNGGRVAGDWIIDQRRRDAHDAATAFLRQHLLNGKLRDENEAREVGRDESAKVIRRIFRKRLH